MLPIHASPARGLYISFSYYRIYALVAASLFAALALSPAAVQAQIDASFSWSASGLRVSFTAADSGAGARYVWIFGDGSQGSGRQTSHSYAQAADYTVILVVIVSDDDQFNAVQIIPASAFNRRTEGSGRRRGSGGGSQSEARPRGIQATCQTLPTDQIRVIPISSETQCQIIDSNPGIGSQEMIEAGWIAAVNVWNVVVPGTEVCFRQPGRLVLLDAGTSPRSIIPLEVYASDPWTCTQIDRAGTVVLLRGAPAVETPEATPTAVRLPVPPEVWRDNSPIIELEDCRVRTRVYVNFRFSPGGPPIGKTVIRYATSLDAMARTKHWYYVEYEGTSGWISAHLARTAGNCELLAPEDEADSDSG